MAGCVVLVTADRRSGELASALIRRGATVRHAPALSIVPHEHDDELLAHTRELLDAPPDIVVITTGIGFRGWVEAADAAGLADQLVAVLSRARIIARGPKAHGAIQAAGLQADWVAESETSAEILDLLLAEGVDRPAGRGAAPRSRGRRPRHRARRRRGRWSAAWWSTAGDRHPTRSPSSCRSSPPPTVRSTPPSSPPRPVPRRGWPRWTPRASATEIVTRISQRRHGGGRRRPSHRKAVAGQGHPAARARPWPPGRAGPHPRQPLRAGPDLRSR